MTSFPAQHGPADRERPRTSGRRRVRLVAGRIGEGAEARDIVIHDLSTGGCSFASPVPIAPGETVRLRIPHAGDVAARVSWAEDERVGCAFDTPLSPTALAGALASSSVIWGDFTRGCVATSAGAGARAVTVPPTTRPRWGVRAAVIVIALALAAFWAAVAALV